MLPSTIVRALPYVIVSNSVNDFVKVLPANSKIIAEIVNKVVRDLAVIKSNLFQGFISRHFAVPDGDAYLLHHLSEPQFDVFKVLVYVKKILIYGFIGVYVAGTEWIRILSNARNKPVLLGKFRVR